ncbi:MAG: UDP-N-acetylmuramoyl-L-alanine--D-glutamate ligase [Arenicellales bacterium]|nr:UDP-N-acetylmuramoyl-L-alanine--D-glutamate ligase [Arenicellales bacterium]
MEAALRIDSNGPPWRRAVVFGLGATGYSCARYLSNLGVIVSVQDSRTEPPCLESLKRACPEVGVHTGSFVDLTPGAADLVVVSPGVALSEPVLKAAEQQNFQIVGDVELFARACTAPVVAITGSNGKSTVTALVGEMLAARGLVVKVGGNIGVPVLDLLGDPPPDVFVLELSSFQLETTSSLESVAAAILNVSPDHLDRYASLDDYVTAKLRIASGAQALVLCRDDPGLAGVRTRGEARTMTFGHKAPATDSDYGLLHDENSVWLVCGERRLLDAASLSLTGYHNLANALAAIALVEAFGQPIDPVSIAALCAFKGLPHRCEWLGEKDGVAWINDSKSTNPGAAVAALSGVGRPVVLIAGGLSKQADFVPLADAVRRYARQVVLIGRDRMGLAAVLGDSVPVTLADDLAHAVTLAARWAQAGDAVLLSPGCASFDMFRNFEHRGEEFRWLVKEMIT